MHTRKSINLMQYIYTWKDPICIRSTYKDNSICGYKDNIATLNTPNDQKI